MQKIFENGYYALMIGDEHALVYCMKGSDEKIELTWPRFEIDGAVSGEVKNFRLTGERKLNEFITEIKGEGELDAGAALGIELRVCKETPVVRFRYVLSANAPKFLTKANGENLTYFSYDSGKDARRTEVRLSNYDQLTHCYAINELPAFDYEDEVMGPILTEQRGGVCLLTAYEHGSMYPDKFVAFTRTEDGIALKALRGNYWAGESICERWYETIWLQMGAVCGTHDDMAKVYRDFQLNYCTLNMESRKPYIFYNSWCFQERNKFYNGKAFLSSMNQARMEEEIEIAHRMGVDVFVMDTGWYQKTGDWEPNLSFFPDGLASIRKKLDAYGMKLGLWFNPIVAAKTSRIFSEHTDALLEVRGQEPRAHSIWETEESYTMCLVSDYWEAFADELIRLSDTLGVKYFKWDGIGMYGCESGCHLHGGPDTSSEESRDCYAFRMVQYMSKVIDKLCSTHPDVIVDFDITEGMRSMGLAFLSSGKYFAINNGPYYPNYDIDVPEDVWSNIFVFPGPARTWICRQNLSYDKWIPSVLFMAHYLPDDPKDSQLINLASLILGQNGFWGDLPAISKEGVAFIRSVLDVYKRVRDDITSAGAVVTGKPGELIEVHEKLNAQNGRGAVSLFANHAGEFRFRLKSRNISDKTTVFGNGKLVKKDGKIWLEASFEKPGAVIAFFE